MPATPLAPGDAVMYLGASPDWSVVTFHFRDTTPPLTLWWDRRSRHRWSPASPDDAPPVQPATMVGPCEKPVGDVDLTPEGVTFRWPFRAPLAYRWVEGQLTFMGAMG